MYIIKNATRNIVKMKGRSFLIFIIVLIISTAACVALGIQGSADKAKEVAFENVEITAQISVDRSSMMGQGGFDRENMEEMMGQMTQQLPLEDAIAYSEASEVSNFYYNSSTTVNVTDITAYEISSGMLGGRGEGGMGGGMMGGGKPMGDSGVVMGTYTVTGYSSLDGMQEFVDGILQVSEGSVFDIESDDLNVLISQEIAFLNELNVGDTIEIQNPQDETVVVTATISGLFTCESTDQYANTIYMSQNAFDNMMSTINADDSIMYQSSPTYVFKSIEDYESFQTSVVELGLDDTVYSVNSQDIEAFEQSLVPLESLSTFVFTFLIIVLIIGAAVLALFNLFIIRERKYEIGVLSAMGMKKGKVVSQFITESLIVCILAIVLSIGIGTVIATPVGETLLAGQIQSIEDESDNRNNNFGMGDMPMGGSMDKMSFQGGFNDISYIEDIEIGISPTMLLQLLLIGIVLSFITSAVSVITILRYEPLKILSER